MVFVGTGQGHFCPCTNPGPRRPTLRMLCGFCGCHAIAELFGFPVCAYHLTHNEDAAPCPSCGQADAIVND